MPKLDFVVAAGEGTFAVVMIAALSMNRTACVTLAVALFVAPGLPAQVGPGAVAGKTQRDPIDELVAKMVAGEQSLKSLAMELSTTGTLGAGVVVRTRGTLHVVRGTQAACHTKLEFLLDQGVKGRSESAQTAGGIVLLEDDPVLGPVYVHFDPKLVADLEWAGDVLGAEHLPGMQGRRASAPLGSTLVQNARTHFDLTVDPRTDRQGEPGVWLVGRRKRGLDPADPDLPVADATELFVRSKDMALLELRQLQGNQVVQQIVVEKLEVDTEIPASVFVVDGGGLRLRPVQQHQPLADTIEQTLKQAERKNKDGLLRPSKR